MYGSNPRNMRFSCRLAVIQTCDAGRLAERRICLAYRDFRCSLSANCPSTFDAAAHFYRGNTMSFALPAAMPAESLVCLGPNLILTRFNCTGFFSECFISSATDTSKDDKTPVALCLRHRNSPRGTVGSDTIILFRQFAENRANVLHRWYAQHPCLTANR